MCNFEDRAAAESCTGQAIADASFRRGSIQNPTGTKREWSKRIRTLVGAQLASAEVV